MGTAQQKAPSAPGRFFEAFFYFSQAKLINRTISRGIPTRNPIIQNAPARFPRFIVHPIHGIDFGTQVRLSFLLK
jgi:hypothetical protein